MKTDLADGVLLPRNQPGYTAAHMRATVTPVLKLALLALLPCVTTSQCLAQTQPGTGAGGPVPGYRAEQPQSSLHAMVVSVHHLASDAGLLTLQKGGNAVDAAVATAFMLSVVHPFAGNLGGGGFMLLHLSGENGKRARTAPRDTFIDFRETAPAAASANMYLNAQGSIIPGDSTIGPRSIGVPGSVAGLVYAEKTYGRLGLAAVLRPAIRMAEVGFQLTEQEARLLNDPHLRDYPQSRAIFGQKSWVSGDTLRQPALAKTLGRIAADPDSFYRGDLAKELAAGLKREGALITEQDLAAYHAVERVPLRGSFAGLTVVSAPPPSSGGVTLLETLNILSAPPAPALQAMGDRSAGWIHWVAEAFRRAYMDRNEYLGDPAFVNMPIEQMLSPEYAEAWRRTIDPQAASTSAGLERPAGYLPPPPAEGGTRLSMAAGANGEKAETTHFSVLDAEGNAVAVTTTLNGAFGSYETAPGLGFLLNDEMDDFTSKPGSPNMFGLVQGPANSIAPGKRPLSSMTPTIVLAADGKVRFVLGSPGGSFIPSTVINILLSAQIGGLNIQSAVDAPRFHHQFLPDTLLVEPGFDPERLSALRTLGYPVRENTRPWSNGECIARDPDTGVLTAGQDHRQNFGKAAGY